MKGEKDFEKPKEIMIRNYRLVSLINDQEVTDDERKFMTKNEGTNIYVSNSIIKNEIFKFSTHVQENIA